VKLVECLVAGIAGATSGSATFVLRGTASSAASVLYTDFEGTAQPGTNIITLDSNGCAEVYVNALCDMTLKTSAGATLRTVTVGDTATTVEVISTAFTGTDYSGSPTDVNEPTTLASILDRWGTSSGSFDWKVSVGGTPTNLSSAIAAFSGLFTNVKSSAFGALGDGVTDDTTAINNAITAAAGGIVFFPPGTYVVSVLTCGTSNLYLMGAGSGSSIISGNSAGTRVINVTDNTSNKWKKFEGLRITSSATYTRLVDVEETQNISFVDCDFDGTNCNGALINRPDVDGQSNIFFDRCKFTAGESSPRCIDNNSDDAESYFSVKNCYFTATTNYSGIVIDGPDFTISGCEFDLLSSTGGGYTFISPSSNETAGKFLGTVTNCVFRTGASVSFPFNLTTAVGGSKFHESGNIFYGFDVTDHTTASNRLYNYSHGSGTDFQITLLSRECRSLMVSGAFGAAETIACFQDYGSVLLSATDVAATLTLTIDQDDLPPGSKATCSVRNSSGSAKTIVHATAGTWTNVANIDEILISMIYVQDGVGGGGIKTFFFPDSTVD
jgi:hypothetical protein